MTDAIRRQRSALCDLLDSLSAEQWSAETLCEGWDAGDIASHLIIREREPLAALGILITPLSGITERRQAARAAKGRSALVATLRKGPTPWMRIGPMGDTQVGEDWIHAADIARGGAATATGPALPRLDGTEDPEIARLLWKAVGRFAPLTLRGLDQKGAVMLTDGSTSRTYTVGGGMARSAPDATPDVTITGPVGDLVLFSVGRHAIEVDATGDATLIEALLAASRAV